MTRDIKFKLMSIGLIVIGIGAFLSSHNSIKEQVEVLKKENISLSQKVIDLEDRIKITETLREIGEDISIQLEESKKESKETAKQIKAVRDESVASIDRSDKEDRLKDEMKSSARMDALWQYYCSIDSSSPNCKE